MVLVVEHCAVEVNCSVEMSLYGEFTWELHGNGNGL